MSLRRLLGFVALLGVVVNAVALPRGNPIALAGTLHAAGERAALGAFGVSLPVEAVSAPMQAVGRCPDFAARAVVAVILERVAFRDMRLGQTHYFRQRAAKALRLSACS